MAFPCCDRGQPENDLSAAACRSIINLDAFQVATLDFVRYFRRKIGLNYRCIVAVISNPAFIYRVVFLISFRWFDLTDPDCAERQHRSAFLVAVKRVPLDKVLFIELDFPVFIRPEDPCPERHILLSLFSSQYISQVLVIILNSEEGSFQCCTTLRVFSAGILIDFFQQQSDRVVFWFFL